MKIGMNLLLYTTQPDESIFPTCEKLKEMGYDGLEWPLFELEKKTAKKIRKFNETNALDASTVVAFGPGLNPLSEEKSERKAALTYLKSRIELTAEMGAQLLCGPFVQPLGHFTGTGPTKDEFERCVEYLQKAADFAAEHEVTLVLEYLNRFEIYFVNTAADAVKVCQAVDRPNFKTMVDSFHANIEERNFYDPVITAKPYLAHIHISENDRGIPGAGNNIRWDDFFRGIKDSGYDGYLTIEAFSSFLPDLAGAAKIWRPLFKSPDDVCSQGIAFIRRMLETIA